MCVFTFSLRAFEIRRTLQAVNVCVVTRNNRNMISSTKVAFGRMIRGTRSWQRVRAGIMRITGLVPHPIRKLFEFGQDL
jgi:hypothetical protein